MKDIEQKETKKQRKMDPENERWIGQQKEINRERDVRKRDRIIERNKKRKRCKKERWIDKKKERERERTDAEIRNVKLPVSDLSHHRADF